MSIDHNIWWNVGRDKRRPTNVPRFKKGTWSSVSAYHPLNANTASDQTGFSGPLALPRCSDPANPPNASDTLGQTYPAGTVFIPESTLGPTWSPNAGSLRLPGNNAAIIIAPSFSPVGNPGLNDLLYVASGIPSGASFVLTITGNATSTSYYNSGAVTPGVSIYYLEIPTFTVSASDTTVTIKVVWTNGTPAAEGIGTPPGASTNYAGGAAVPSTLPAGYTLNTDTGQSRGSASPNCGGSQRLLSGPNLTYASMGLSGLGYAGLGNVIWIGGIPYKYLWLPIAIGRTVLGASATYIAGIIGGSGTVGPTPGGRYAQVSFSYTKITADPQPTDTFTWAVTQDGNPIGGATITGTAIKTIATVPLTISLPAAGVTTTFVLTVSGSAGTAHAWTCQATLSVSPRCDIPLPYTVVGPGTVIPGGYLPSMLQTPDNRQPMTTLAQGVTSCALGSSAGNVLFIPMADGWYQCTISGTAQKFISEDPNGWKDNRKACRGHAGRPFYARTDTGGTVILAPWSPPTPTAIASGGTLCTQDANAWGVFASISLPSAGAWKIKIAAGTSMPNGLVADYSFTDPAVVNPKASKTWEPIVATEFTTSGAFSGQILNNPPAGTNGNPYVWIVGSDPTGAWVGHENDIAVWDAYNAGWTFQTPKAGSYFANTNFWFDGLNWHSNGTDPQLTLPITTTGPQTVYLLVSPMSTELGTNGTMTISWAAA